MKTAQGILSNLCKPKTIYMLVMFAKLLGITAGLHRYLQGERLDLGRAAQDKTAILETLTDLRTEPGAEDVFKSTVTICEEHPGRNKKDWMVLWWSQPVGQPPIRPPQVTSEVSFIIRAWTG
ncbi:hypothetical protein KUCAC02_007105 [Chaenocephalus aceratus]|nr:hypothetical protein KUCAC02_007105 [Chaenocephalus aceratus]